MSRTCDAIIVGGGPAGASCAIWLARLGLRPVVVESRERPGGLGRDNPFPDGWIAVLPEMSGREVAENIARNLDAAGVEVRLDTRAREACAVPDGFEVRLDGPDGESRLRGRTLVVATGVRPRALDEAQGLRDWPGVIVGAGAAVAQADYDGRRVAILGGGDNAFENYGYVRQRGARSVHVYARHVRAQRQFVEAVAEGDLRVGPYTVDPEARTVDGRAYDTILVLYGWVPQADFVRGLGPRHDERGFLWTETATAQTSVDGMYAIGEAAQRMHPCVVTAMADGVVAAKAIQRRLQPTAQALSTQS